MKRRQSGFTLLEALVTLVIVALLVATLMQALSQTLAMRTRLIRFQRQTRVDVLQEGWFRESVAAAVADVPSATGPLQGDASGFEFSTLGPLTGEGLVRATWRLRKGPDGVSLNYRDAPSGDVVVLPGPLEEAEFRYLDASGVWQRDWKPAGQASDAIPRAIQLRAITPTRTVQWTVAIGARPRPPELIRIDADSNAF